MESHGVSYILYPGASFLIEKLFNLDVSQLTPVLCLLPENAADRALVWFVSVLSELGIVSSTQHACDLYESTLTSTL